MRYAFAIGCGLAATFLGGCGPTAEEQAAESFALFARQWATDSYPGKPVLKETSQEVAQGDTASFAVEKGYYQRQTVFEGLRCQVLPTDRVAVPYVGVLRGERIVRSTPVHATAPAAQRDGNFSAAKFAYPEEHVFEYVNGSWRPRRPN